jgi:hypothetical protein
LNSSRVGGIDDLGMSRFRYRRCVVVLDVGLYKIEYRYHGIECAPLYTKQEGVNGVTVVSAD